MDLLQVIILSFVEGITEFLPISSTGHLVLTAHALGIQQTEFVKSFEIIIQLGAILSVIVMYGRMLLTKRNLWKHLIIAFLPSAVIGFTLYPYIKSVLIGNPLITVIALIIGGVILIASELLHKEKKEAKGTLDELTVSKSFLVGLAQAVSIIPGVSRAGATIVGGLLSGLSRKSAVEFSFLLALPTMLAASGLDVIESNLSFTSTEWLYLSVGFILSFIVAFGAMKWLIKFVQNHSFIGFGIYRIILGFIYWFLFLL